MGLVSQSLTSKKSISRLSIIIAQIYPLTNQKGCKSLILETGTTKTGNFKNTLNGIQFTATNWEKYYKKIPSQVRRLIGIGKDHAKTQLSFPEPAISPKQNTSKVSYQE